MPPLYDPKMDDAPNYGNTGGTIGHELTHAFDDEGRQFDGDGQPAGLVDEAGRGEFEKRAQCIRDQYSQYTIVDDIKINGTLTSGEDIADLGGELLAWMAWKEQTKAMRLAERDGLTPDAALLRRLRAVGLRERAAGEPARERHHRPALAAASTRQRRGGEHAGVRRRVQLQGGRETGEEA